MSDNINIIEIIKKALMIAILLLNFGILAVLIQGISKIVRALEGAVSKKSAAPAAAAPAPAAAPVAAPAAPSAGVQLVGVDEPTAAVIMAIVSNESGIPLNRLSFKSIKITEDK